MTVTQQLVQRVLAQPGQTATQLAVGIPTTTACCAAMLSKMATSVPPRVTRRQEPSAFRTHQLVWRYYPLSAKADAGGQ